MARLARADAQQIAAFGPTQPGSPMAPLQRLGLAERLDGGESPRICLGTRQPTPGGGETPEQPTRPALPLRPERPRFSGDGGPYTIDSRPLPLSRLPTGRLTRLFTYWQSRFSGAALPARRDIDPLTFFGALGWVSLLEIEDEPLRFRYLWDGGRVAADRGKDLTDLTTDDAEPWPLGEILRTNYSWIAESGTPTFFELGVLRRADEVGLLQLALPLSDRGRDVDHILAVSIRRDHIET